MGWSPLALAIPIALISVKCPDKNADYWEQFNGNSDSVEVAVTSGDVGAAVVGELHSTTESVIVGTVEVDPGSGPVGTEHEVRVQVDEAFEGDVGLVTLETDGQRGLAKHELRQDSADHGLWVVSVTSLGGEGEERTDTFRVLLWTSAEKKDSGAVDDPTE